MALNLFLNVCGGLGGIILIISSLSYYESLMETILDIKLNELLRIKVFFHT